MTGNDRWFPFWSYVSICLGITGSKLSPNKIKSSDAKPKFLAGLLFPNNEQYPNPLGSFNDESIDTGSKVTSETTSP